MICKLKVENFKAFSDSVEVSFYADNNIKRFEWNLNEAGNKKIVKTSSFYGPNNTGKTCLLLSLMNLRNLMLNEPHTNMVNSFSDKGDVTRFEIEYFSNGSFYTYIVCYNNKAKMYEYEELNKLQYREDSAYPLKTQIVKRSETSLSFIDIPQYLEKLSKAQLAQLFSPNIPIMISMDLKDNALIQQSRKDYLDFAKSLILLRMDQPIDITKTLNLMRENKKAERFIRTFVKNCDLNIDDFGSTDNIHSDINIDEEISLVSLNPSFPKESLKIFSVHNGYTVPSVFFDSIGTQKIIALSGYIYEAVHDGKILLIDEIDSSLHHVITRALVALFNNSLNTKAQLLFTTHDALLMDLQHLLRKDQIWLLDIRDKCSSSVLRMSDEFTARKENGIRGDENIVEYYVKGRFGSIPSPDLFDTLLEATSDE